MVYPPPEGYQTPQECISDANRERESGMVEARSAEPLGIGRVYCQMTGKRGIEQRLKQLLAEAGFRVAILRSRSVKTRDRLEWIEKRKSGARHEIRGMCRPGTAGDAGCDVWGIPDSSPALLSRFNFI